MKIKLQTWLAQNLTVPNILTASARTMTAYMTFSFIFYSVVLLMIGFALHYCWMKLRQCRSNRSFDIFLSYRRSHMHLARCIKQQLELPRLGKDGILRRYKVFFDVESIGATSNFQKVLFRKLKECKVR